MGRKVDPWRKGCESKALAVHPKLVKAHREQMERDGVRGVEVKGDGTVVFHGRAARREYVRRYAPDVHDLDGGYSDP